MTSPGSQQITVGDVWDALEGGGFQQTKAATGKRLLAGPAQQTIFLHGKELAGWRVAAASLIEQVNSWGIQPVASGKYPPPPKADTAALPPYAALSQQPRNA